MASLNSMDMNLSKQSRREWRTGKSSVLQSMGSQRILHNWATEQWVLDQQPQLVFGWSLERKLSRQPDRMSVNLGLRSNSLSCYTVSNSDPSQTRSTQNIQYKCWTARPCLKKAFSSWHQGCLESKLPGKGKESYLHLGKQSQPESRPASKWLGEDLPHGR